MVNVSGEIAMNFGRDEKVIVLSHIAFFYFKMHRCTGNEGFETNVEKRRGLLTHGTLNSFIWYYGNMVIPSNLLLNSAVIPYSINETQ